MLDSVAIASWRVWQHRLRLKVKKKNEIFRIISRHDPKFSIEFIFHHNQRTKWHNFKTKKQHFLEQLKISKNFQTVEN